MKCCETCKYCAALIRPYCRSDGAQIYGYCFKSGDKDYSPNMGKGYPIFFPLDAGAACKSFKRRREEAERAFQDMVKSMPTCREPDWLPQGFGNAGFEQGVGGAGYSGDEKDFVVYIVEAQGVPGAVAAERREHENSR